jgi:insulysin
MTAADPKQTNGSVVHFVHFGDRAIPRLRVIFRLINNIIHEPAFNILRTQEQLGYIVGSSEWLGTEYMGLRVVVQSERDTKYVESRIEAFYTHMAGVLEQMSPAQFEEHKKGLVHEWNKKLKSLREEYYRFFEAIQSGYLDFSRGMCCA